ncbi:MAG: heme biosynthesis protein HemY [Halocynthiibacter sp.]
MLWSLTKLSLFLVAVVAVAFGANMLLDVNEAFRVIVADKEYTLGPLQMLVAVILSVILLWVVLKLVGLFMAWLRFMNGDETAMTRYFNRNREKRGFEALSDGMLAIATGDARTAMSKANKAEKLLNRPELTNLLAAQAAEASGDKRKAEAVYKRLVENEKTRFVGVRGLMKQKLLSGDTETALKLAEKAFSLKPAHREVQDTLLQLQAEKEDWSGARGTLDAKLKHGALPRDVHKRRDAVLALSEAKAILDDGNDIKAREAAIEANRLSPDLIPAAVMVSEGYTAENNTRFATRILKKAWDVQPHPDLAAAFAKIVPDETPEARIKRFKALVKSTPNHAESKMLMAELFIANGDFADARRALGELPVLHPSARALTLMAAIERGEGSDDVAVRGWLTKALTAPRGPQWICDSCGHIHMEWAPTCGKCASFDTLTWKDAPKGEISMPASTEMLPLIVGAVEKTPGDGDEHLAPMTVDKAKVVDAELADDAPSDKT